MINGTSIEGVHVTTFTSALLMISLIGRTIFFISGKLSKSIAMLIYRASHILDKNALLTCSFLLPNIPYCTEVWGNTYHSNLSPVFYKTKQIEIES